MDVLHYYSTQKLELTDIQSCVSQSDYESAFQWDPVLHQTALYVSFNPTRLPEHKSYWRWEAHEMEWANIDPEESKTVSSVRDKVQSLSAIWYPMLDMGDFGQMMKAVMVCHGGYVCFESNLFDVDNILSIQDYVPRPPDELMSE